MPRSAGNVATGYRYLSFLFNAVTCCLLLALGSCAPVRVPLIEVPASHAPLFIDDLATADLLQAIDRQIVYLQKLSAKQETGIAGYRFSAAHLLDSLSSFRDLVAGQTDPLVLSRRLREQFHVFQATGRTADHSMLVTGYYEPLFAGSLTREGPYRFPLYRVPDSLVVRTDPATGDKQPGRIDAGGTFRPYWTRKELEDGQLLSGHELVYLRDPFDAYLMHVQGSGRIRLPDGSIQAVQFAATNGLTYNSLGKLFVDRGILSRNEVSIPAIRAYFADHPEDLEEMLHHNPRYVFFRQGDATGPRGSLGLTLTPNRSAAIDHQVLPTGAIGFLLSKRPVLDASGSISHWRPYGRFLLPQDSGAAITGPGRIDLFCGSGPAAETVAGHLNEPGKLFFLVKKSATDFASPR